MQNFSIEQIFSNYSLVTIIIATISSVFDFIAEKTFLKKAHAVFKNYLAILLAVILSLGYNCIFVYGKFIITLDGVMTGLMAGLLSTIFSMAVKKILSGESLSASPTSLLVEGLLDGFIEDTKITGVVDEIVMILHLLGIDEINEAEIKEKISSIIKDNAKIILSEKDLSAIVELIIKTIKDKKEK